MPLLQPAEVGRAAAGVPGVAEVLHRAQAALPSLALRPQPACAAAQYNVILYIMVSSAYYSKSWHAHMLVQHDTAAGSICNTCYQSLCKQNGAIEQANYESKMALTSSLCC